VEHGFDNVINVDVYDQSGNGTVPIFYNPEQIEIIFFIIEVPGR